MDQLSDFTKWLGVIVAVLVILIWMSDLGTTRSAPKSAAPQYVDLDHRVQTMRGVWVLECGGREYIVCIRRAQPASKMYVGLSVTGVTLFAWTPEEMMSGAMFRINIPLTGEMIEGPGQWDGQKFVIGPAQLTLLMQGVGVKFEYMLDGFWKAGAFRFCFRRRGDDITTIDVYRVNLGCRPIGKGFEMDIMDDIVKNKELAQAYCTMRYVPETNSIHYSNALDGALYMGNVECQLAPSMEREDGVRVGGWNMPAVIKITSPTMMTFVRE